MPCPICISADKLLSGFKFLFPDLASVTQHGTPTVYFCFQNLLERIVCKTFIVRFLWLLKQNYQANKMSHFNIVFGLQNGGVTRADKSRDLIFSPLSRGLQKTSETTKKSQRKVIAKCHSKKSQQKVITTSHS